MSSSAGRVYTYGSNKYGVLGWRNDTETTTECGEIEDLTDIAAVALGPHHSCALDVDGNVFTWGWNGSFFSGRVYIVFSTTHLFSVKVEVLVVIKER